ncbi:MAG: hypothetical protein ACOX9B_11760 [Candidatus Xenobium sp.]|jgi:hypothetical protein|nr:hypothetical protein [Burkholderiales bacterium]
MAQTQTQIDLDRLADEMNVILTDIFGRYVAQGSPTKLGGLRFLDVQSSKTFAFEKTEVSEDKTGNLLVLSAPYRGTEEDIRKALTKGPYGKEIRRVTVRGSADAGKADKRFVEVAYYMPTASWLTDEAIMDFAKKHKMTSSRDALTGILKEKVLPPASEVMEYLISEIRATLDH